MRRLKCDEESLRAVNPDVIYCHTRGFDRGPRSDSPGNDQTGCSLAGVTHEDGGCNDGGKPFWSLTSLGDTGNGFFSAIGVIQALYHRRRTGEAQTVDTSILNAGNARRLDDGGEAGRHQPAQAAAGCDAARAEPVLPAVRDERRLGLPGGGRRGAPAARWRRSRPVDGLEAWFGARSAKEAFETLDAAGVPCEIADDDSRCTSSTTRR